MILRFYVSGIITALIATTLLSSESSRPRPKKQSAAKALVTANVPPEDGRFSLPTDLHPTIAHEQPILVPSAQHQTPALRPASPEHNTSDDELERGAKIPPAQALSLRRDGWDLTALDGSDPSTTQRPPSPDNMLSIVMQLITAASQRLQPDIPFLSQKINYLRDDHFYETLLGNTAELRRMIHELNDHEAGEGNRWLDKALSQACKDNRPDIILKLWPQCLNFQQSLPKTTLQLTARCLVAYAQRQQANLVETVQEYTTHIAHISDIVRQVEELEPAEVITADQALQQAHLATRNLTIFASSNLLPQAPTQ